MKYKVGDRVKIKIWKQIDQNIGYYEEMERQAIRIDSDRVLTIDRIDVCYFMKKISFAWTDDMIECLVERPIPVNNRWELLDL